jgi:hypothetical protein
MQTLLGALLVVVLVVATVQSAERTYDRYGLYGVGHPAGGWVLDNPPGYEDMVWRRIAEAGATSCRIAASWRELEPEKGKFDWSQLEETLKYCRKYPQIRPYLLVVNTPGWARPDGKPSHLPPMESAIPYWKRFCRELAKRYKGFVRHFEIWNEQNGFGWEAPPFHQIDKYLPLFKAAYEGLKEGNPDCVVSLGGLDDAEGYSPIEAKGYYEARTKKTYGELKWDAFADHPYGDTASMKEKLRAIQRIAAEHGDAGVEMWLTEYGWHTGQMSFEDQAKNLTEYMTTLILDPEFKYVTETNYLCVADFEATTRGFGLCDVNLRPRPAFYAYQRLPRPGQIVISDIRVEHLNPTAVKVCWATDSPAKGIVRVGMEEGKYTKTFVEDKITKQHSVVLNNLKPNTNYHFIIKCYAGGFPEAKSLDYEFTTLPTKGLANPGFEEGFIVEIAKRWECIGPNICWDSARLKEGPRIAHSGKHAQCIVAHGQWGDGLDDVVVTQASARVGENYRFAVWTYASSADKSGRIVRRVGIDPTGGKDPKSPSVIWSSLSETLDSWEKLEVVATAKSQVVTVFVHARSVEKGNKQHYFYVDDAELTEE